MTMPTRTIKPTHVLNERWVANDITLDQNEVTGQCVIVIAQETQTLDCGVIEVAFLADINVEVDDEGVWLERISKPTFKVVSTTCPEVFDNYAPSCDEMAIIEGIVAQYIDDNLDCLVDEAIEQLQMEEW